MGPEDHIQVDLADEASTLEAIAETKRRLDGHELHALVNNAAISPKADGGKRLSTLNTSKEDWHHVFQVNFFAPIMLARGLVEELKAAKGSAAEPHPDRRLACASIRRCGLFDLEKCARPALTREMTMILDALASA